MRERPFSFDNSVSDINVRFSWREQLTRDTFCRVVGKCTLRETIGHYLLFDLEVSYLEEIQTDLVQSRHNASQVLA